MIADVSMLHDNKLPEKKTAKFGYTFMNVQKNELVLLEILKKNIYIKTSIKQEGKQYISI